MTRDEYVKFHTDMCQRMMSLTADKNADYTGHGDDPFANLTLGETLGVGSTVQGLLFRMCDKMSRLVSLLVTGRQRVLSESVEDTLLDLANYCILLAGYLKSKDSVKVSDNEQELITSMVSGIVPPGNSTACVDEKSGRIDWISQSQK